MPELTTIQQSWLKAKVIEFGMRCSKEYFKHYSSKNPDAKAINDWVNKTDITEDREK